MARNIGVTMAASPAVVISLDAELGWGFLDHDEIPRERVRNARDSWQYLLELFATYEIPATWAVVGHLFLDSCDGIHANHPAGKDWFARDPGGEYTPDSEWFGQDLIDGIRESEIDHDIGSHTFSHIEFGKKDVSREVAAAELQYSIDAAENYGVDLNSFVFPRNNIGYRELLAEYDFLCYRGQSPERWYDGRPLRQAGKLATFTFGTASPPIVTPEVDEYGMINVPASMYLFTFTGSIRDAVGTVTGDPIIRQVKLGLEELKDREHGLLHLWSHPNNITTNRDRHRLEQLLSMIAEYRRHHEIEIETMSQITRCETDE